MTAFTRFTRQQTQKDNSARRANRKDISTAQNGVTMQHRHFAFIAATIAAMVGCDRETIANDFANALQRTNGRFDRERFLAACDPDGYTHS
jgi:hypothetical protein